MKKSIAFILFLALFTTFSCKKENISTATSTTQEISLYEKLTATNANVEGTIAFKSIGNISKGNPEQIDIDGIFKDKSGKTLKTETFQVAQFDVEEKANSSLAYYKYFNNSTSNFKSIVSNFYENQVKVVVKSKGFGDISTSLYSPSVVQIELPSNVKNTLKLNKNQGLTIKWTPDAKLGVGNEGEQQVGASIVYHTQYLKNTGKTNLPTDNITVYKLANDLTGEINFTADDLAALPSGGEVHIFLARANQNTATSSADKKMCIISFSMSYLQEVIVQ
jgi:hypothetical protein